ncbi:hypothetical protein AB1N83_001979 [Pleurotus pulmonarius]|nr:hypothetical protein EYR38_006728 [Pleurotus pulmonarius]
MSYAQVAAENAPPLSEQPKPDQALLNTAPSTPVDKIIDDTSKLNVVDRSLKDHPVTTTSKARMDNERLNGFPYDDDRKPRKSKRIQEAEAEGAYLWQVTKKYIFRPGVAGGLVGLVNAGLLVGAGHALYTQPHLRNDRRFLTTVIGSALALLTVEGYAAEKYRQTPRGQAEEQRAKDEGTLIYKHVREVILRPGVLGGLVGLLNTAVLGTVGYFSYINWDRRSWDRRTVSAVSVGLLALFGAEGVIAEQFRSKRH